MLKMLTRKKIAEKYDISSTTINRRIKKYEIRGHKLKGKLLGYTPEQVKKITAKPMGLLLNEAIDLLKSNGWQHTRHKLSGMLQSGFVKNTKININKTNGTLWRYNKKQLQDLIPVIPEKSVTIAEKAKAMGISRQGYYWLRRNNPKRLKKRMEEAGYEFNTRKD